MKFEEIPRKILSAIISKELGQDVTIKDGVFCKFFLNNVTYYSSSSLDDTVIPAGKILLDDSNSNINLYPSILDCIQNLPTYRISKLDQQISLSHGKSINVEIEEDLVIITDTYDNKIALGRITNNQLKPLIDLGFYLRSE